MLATAVVVSDPEGVVLYANLSAETLLEVSRRSFDGQALAALFVEANLFREFQRKSQADPFGVKRQVFGLGFSHFDASAGSSFMSLSRRIRPTSPDVCPCRKAMRR